ncbi:MAG: neutral zinc metallopeptidase [Microthrixaceae bacterium]
MKARLLIPVAMMALLAGACSTGLEELRAQPDGNAVVIDRSDRPLQPSGPVGSDDSKPYVETLELSISAIQQFWTDAMPGAYGRDFQVIPPEKIFAYSSTVEPPACGPGPKPTYRDLAGNAFYCTEGGFVAFDDEGLMPQLYENFGSYAVAMVLAHEWGHAVQDQMGNSNSGAATVLLEQQADCFAGAWTKWLGDGNYPQLPLNEGTLDAALGGLLEFRDEPGTSSDDPAAHGSGFDRVRAFRDGFGSGVDACVDYERNTPPVLQLPFTAGDYETGGNLPYDELATTLFPDLTAWIAREFPSYVEPTAEEYDPAAGQVVCGSTTVSDADADDRSFYCASDGSVRWDGPWLEGINNSTGDFASSLLVGMQYGVALQSQLGESDEQISSEEGVQQRVCLMGAYAGSLVEEFPVPQQHQLTISGGDLDEALTALIAFTDSTQTGATGSSLAFDRIESFQNGVLEGTSSCGF